MSCVSHCIDYITNADIPDMILEDAFIPPRDRRARVSRSVESYIRKQIFERRIIPDLSRMRGVELSLNLSDLPYEKIQNYQRIYRIPMEKTQGRAIVSAQLGVLNVTSNYAEAMPGQSNIRGSISTLQYAAMRVVASNSPIPNIGNAEIEEIVDNVIKINDYQNFSADMSIICKLSYSNDLSEIRSAYYIDVCDLALAATKAYIYRNLSLMVDKTRLDAGRDFGRYKEFIDEYRDAHQQYRDILDQKMEKVLVLNDQAAKQRHIMKAGKFS